MQVNFQHEHDALQRVIWLSTHLDPKVIVDGHRFPLSSPILFGHHSRGFVTAKWLLIV